MLPCTQQTRFMRHAVTDDTWRQPGQGSIHAMRSCSSCHCLHRGTTWWKTKFTIYRANSLLHGYWHNRTVIYRTWQCSICSISMNIIQHPISMFVNQKACSLQMLAAWIFVQWKYLIHYIQTNTSSSCSHQVLHLNHKASETQHLKTMQPKSARPDRLRRLSKGHSFAMFLLSIYLQKIGLW